MAIKNYTTKIASEKTITEIETLLIKFGAGGIYKEYLGNNLSAIMFFMNHKGEKIPFKIPISIEKCRTVVVNAVKEKKMPYKYANEPLRTEQGLRIVLRIIKDWIDSQLSLMQLNLVEPIEIFLPYAYNQITDKTVYQQFIENKDKFLALENKGVD